MGLDHNVLRGEISSSKRYRELKNIESTILGLKHKLPLSLYTELSGRIKEKVMSFEYPNCSVSKISIIYSNGLATKLEPEECHVAMSRGVKISDYIFSHYVSARDFEITDESQDFKEVSASEATRKDDLPDEPVFTTLSPAALNERINFLLRKVENLEKIEKIYTDNIPRIVNDMNDLKDKVNKIYKVLVRE